MERRAVQGRSETVLEEADCIHGSAQEDRLSEMKVWLVYSLGLEVGLANKVTPADKATSNLGSEKTSWMLYRSPVFLEILLLCAKLSLLLSQG